MQHKGRHGEALTEGDEMADELVNAGTMLDEGFFLSHARTITIQQERQEVYAALQYAAGFHCLVEEWKDCEEFQPKSKEKWFFMDKKRKVRKHQTDWCVTADKYRCMRC